LSEVGAEAFGSLRVQVAEHVAEEAVRPMRHEVSSDVKAWVSPRIGRQIGRELVAYFRLHFIPSCLVDRHGNETDVDAVLV
jgi:hypothetical protein